ncbi:Long-chain-fatty-acid--CoA ligase [Corynebacterium kalinowskii]|uniref:Long-chain-fatty-acid--CoA ligase n=1 Tax=Corynebacterium kalinowskii TaxID=2675216 RepID=A0A6B8V8F4_9CORY|nr:AMP-binding protein [Corynebacterium kalinowskii]QGU01392.1 Long-chain-fatty-acid--CoA ligase [Corynebacterium kalinowskii]
MSGSLYQAVFGHDLPETTAMVTGDASVTYPELAELIDDAAAHLSAQGIGERHVVGVQLPNGIDFATLLHATAKIGAIVAPLPMHLSHQDRSQLLRAVDARLLVTAAEAPQLIKPRGQLDSPTPHIDPEQLACLPFSSGTTGTPKAVMLSHRALAANIAQFAQVLPLQSGETCLSVLPFSHIYGLTALLNVPLAKRARVIAQDFARDSFLKAHPKHQVNLTFIAPPLARLLADAPHLTPEDFRSLHTIVSGAAPLDPRVAARVQNRLGARVMQGFGLTETAPVTHLAWQRGTALDSIGHPLPGTSISVRNPDTLEPAEQGEMWVSGPQVMSGYLGDPDATARTLIDGWVRTGDIVRRKHDGSYVVVDRLKDLIKYHGFQVSPVKLEQLIATMPGVTDVAVARGFDSLGDERPEAFVVGAVSANEVMTFVADRVAGFEKIRAVHLVDRIPRSAAGKILRRELTRT